ncbi:hypothetical protein V5799_010376 [Amblyomma americanum]|uniref:Uncharacterized protein n=1 Tax=Amblyomma americanum TaxID=6943 RepID=A0AAQ4EKV0_AMBAM
MNLRLGPGVLGFSRVLRLAYTRRFRARPLEIKRVDRRIPVHCLLATVLRVETSIRRRSRFRRSSAQKPTTASICVFRRNLSAQEGGRKPGEPNFLQADTEIGSLLSVRLLVAHGSSGFGAYTRHD